MKNFLKYMNFNRWLYVMGAILIIVAIISVMASFQKEDPLGGRTISSGTDSISSYVTEGQIATAVHSGPVFLDRIIIGNDLAGGGLILANATDSVASPFFQLTDATTLQGVWEIGVNLSEGLCATVSSGLWTTFIYNPK